jgi:His-Xaa-Ser system radical SAM maturase HxsC
VSLKLHTHARVEGVTEVEILKVLSPSEAAGSHLPSDTVLLWSEDAEGVVLLHGGPAPIRVTGLKDRAVVQPGDVVRLRPGATQVSVLYRRGVSSNALFATERCNSLCVMCSQPPREVDDAWRVAELLRLIPLIDPNVPLLTITGGEPTLLGEGLDAVLRSCRRYLPDTPVQVLTNGRTLADRALTERLAAVHPAQATWAVPLYADVAAVHDVVVAADGAFEETLQGLYELGRLGARVEIRVVLHKLTIPRLPALAAFLYRRLPFVAHVALMGLEPMGLAKGRHDTLWIDPDDYREPLAAAVFHLAQRGLPVSIYNLPLCALDRSLWPYARQSISGWKNDFLPECQPCAVKTHCAGFFASAGTDWRGRTVRPFLLEEFAA